MEQHEHHDAFISFAEPDKRLAELLRDLLSSMGLDAFVASADLPKVGTPEWREAIREAIGMSRTFVPIYTRHSLRRPWVLYESGMADALKVPQFPARVSNISVQDTALLPSGGSFCYDLSEEQSIIDLLANVGARGGRNRGRLHAEASRFVRGDQGREVIALAKTRWVFIAGNLPAEMSTSTIPWYTTRATYEFALRDFAAGLTQALLKEGFSVTACPQVDALGLYVTNKALECINSGSCPDWVDFGFGGIHPIDRTARELDVGPEAKRKWMEHIMQFRKSYLSGQEWLLAIGGSLGTEEEYEVARQCGVRLAVIPCFGGTAAKTAEASPADMLPPCRECTSRDGRCDPARIMAIVDSLKEPA